MTLAPIVWNIDTAQRWALQEDPDPYPSPRPLSEVGSPEWWRDVLYYRLDRRAPLLGLYDAYYAGAQRLAFATSKFRETFGNLFRAFSDNWCDLVVDATVERLRIEGFRIGTDDPEGAADDAAWAIWQANGMNAEANMAHLDAVKLGASYVAVGPGNDSGTPAMVVLSPYQAIVAVDPMFPRNRVAGLRCWHDDTGNEHAVVYLPQTVHWWIRTDDKGQWQDDIGTGRNPLGVVPIVPLPNQPSLRWRQGRSEIDRVIPLQDAVNKLTADMIIASEYAAFRQRFATGVEIPTDPNTGEPMTGQFLSAVSRMFTVKAPDAKFGDFEVTDLTNYVKAIEMLIQHVAAQTRTPPHYLLGQSGSFPSGESLKATETGLVAKVRRKQLNFGEGWEDAIRLALAVSGDTARAADPACEVIWANPESRSEAETVDALTKMATLGVPQPALWSRWGATPQEVERWTTYNEAHGGDISQAPVTIRATEQLGPTGQPVTGAVPVVPPPPATGTPAGS